MDITKVRVREVSPWNDRMYLVKLVLFTMNQAFKKAKSYKLTALLLSVILIVTYTKTSKNSVILEKHDEEKVPASTSAKWIQNILNEDGIVNGEKYIMAQQEVLQNKYLDEEDEFTEFQKNKGKTKSADECPNYVDYSKKPHEPLSNGPLKLPFMRPPEKCRTFKSETIENVIDDFKEMMEDPDLFRLFENCLPNTLDTTILWHVEDDLELNLPLTFVVTGDIHAEWLRDAARQLSVYQKFAKYDVSLRNMIKGAIIQQALYVIKAPYCNAFQPPEKSGVNRKGSSIDDVFPMPSWKHVFECKYELDSLASFLTLSNDYYENTKDDSIFKSKTWLKAYKTLLMVLRRESSSTFNSDGKLQPAYYTFQRWTKAGTETLPLSGLGNPVNYDTGLVRSAFRPSDDACIYQLFIPANAHLYTELKRVRERLFKKEFIETTDNYIREIKEGIHQYGIVEHPIFGKVYAYEVDGYGGMNIMDDANLPSLLSLPDMGFVDKEDSIYQNTRKMVLSTKGNPYYIKGKYFEGIGGPHVGIQSAWPMSLLVAIRTSDDDSEITKYLEMIKSSTAGLGLMHESIEVNSVNSGYSRPWFAWCNSEFGKTILDLAERKPHLIFKEGVSSYNYQKLHIL